MPSSLAVDKLAEGASDLIESLHDPDMRGRAAAALGNAGEFAVPTLVNLFGHPDPKVSLLAVDVLSKIGPAAVPVLWRALGTSDGKVRYLAADALRKIGPHHPPVRPEVTQQREALLKGSVGVDDDNIRENVYSLPMNAASALKAAAVRYGLSEDVAKAIEDLAANAARENTVRAPAKPRLARLKWETDRKPDEDPATFAWRAYAAEAAAGSLHRGVIYNEDRELHRRLNSWLRSHPMPEGIDIPTFPDWNTRQIAAGKAKRAPARPPRTEGQRLYDVVVKRRRARPREATQ